MKWDLKKNQRKTLLWLNNDEIKKKNPLTFSVDSHRITHSTYGLNFADFFGFWEKLSPPPLRNWRGQSRVTVQFIYGGKLSHSSDCPTFGRCRLRSAAFGCSRVYRVDLVSVFFNGIDNGGSWYHLLLIGIRGLIWMDQRLYSMV